MLAGWLARGTGADSGRPLVAGDCYEAGRLPLCVEGRADRAARHAGCCEHPPTRLPIISATAAPTADAKKPEDWDDEEDGDWEAPRIANPKCTDAPGCGEWKRPTKAVS